MTNYTKTTDFAAKDALPSGNSAKIVKGSEIDTEFNNIATASATKANANDAALTGTTTFETISDGTIAITAFVDEDNMASDSATLLPTQQSVKAYVDSQVTAQDLDFQADSGGALSIDLDSETLTFTGGTGVDTSGSGNAVTFAIDSTVATLTGSQTLSNKTLSAPVVSGNLTTDGLIDGRDVATDGTKLDGIEAGATADQTAAEIRTLVESATDSNVFTDADHSKLNGIEANATADQTAAEIRALVESATDSNVFTDADHSKLNGIEASADVTDTANVTAAGALMDSELTSEASVKALNQGVATTDSPTFAGLTTTADVNFGDNDKAIFGAGNDLQIYHDGSNSVIKDIGTGDLNIFAADNLRLLDTNSKNFLYAAQNADVRLYYNGSQKLATTSTGIDVTGTVTADGLTVDGGNTIRLNASSTNDFLTLTQNGTQAVITADSDATGSLVLQTTSAGSSADRLEIAAGGDISFYEDTGTTPKFFWDASAESLGIGTSSPVSDAQLTISDSANPSLFFNRSGFGDYDAAIKVTTGSAITFLNGVDSSTVSGLTERMRIDASGNVNIYGDDNRPLAITSFDTVSAGAGWDLDATSSNGVVTVSTGGSERMRIDSSGNLLVGTTDTFVGDNSTGGGISFASGGAASFARSAGTVMYVNRTGSSAGEAIEFRYSGGDVGNISVTASATAYNTSSDQRLKDNIVDAPSASDDIDAIQVRSFDWKADGSHQKYGMVAQELQSVAPEAVSGDADSDEMMGVDYSKLVPMLVKEIQSLRNRVAQLENN